MRAWAMSALILTVLSVTSVTAWAQPVQLQRCAIAVSGVSRLSGRASNHCRADGLHRSLCRALGAALDGAHG